MSESGPPAAPIPIRPTQGSAGSAPFGTTTAPGRESTTKGEGVSEPDWTDQVADLVVDTVDKVRDRTTGPVVNVARYVVFGIVAVIVVIPLAVLGIILVGRLLELIPGEVWISYVALGAVLVLVGMMFWRKRRAT